MFLIETNDPKINKTGILFVTHSYREFIYNYFNILFYRAIEYITNRSKFYLPELEIYICAAYY